MLVEGFALTMSGEVLLENILAEAKPKEPELSLVFGFEYDDLSFTTDSEPAANFLAFIILSTILLPTT